MFSNNNDRSQIAGQRSLPCSLEVRLTAVPFPTLVKAPTVAPDPRAVRDNDVVVASSNR